MQKRDYIAGIVNKAVEILGEGGFLADVETGKYLFCEYEKGVVFSPIYEENEEVDGGAELNVFWDGNCFWNPTPFDGVADASDGKILSKTVIQFDAPREKSWEMVDEKGGICSGTGKRLPRCPENGTGRI